MRLQQHVQESITKSKTQHDIEKQRASRRGNLITLISKTSVNYIVVTTGKLIQANIAESATSIGMFTVHVDTTQDVSSKDQCSIVIRFVTDKVHDRLIAVKHSKFGTRENLCKLLVDVMKDCIIDLSKCIGSATDGAANVQGEYQGFNCRLNKESPGQFHICCYACMF